MSLSDRKKETPTVCAILMDMDGCLLSSDLSFDKDGLLPSLEKTHKKLLDTIIQTVKESNPKHLVIMSGSNRQSFSLDKWNGHCYGGFNSFAVLEELTRYFKNHFKDQETLLVTLNKYLIADSFAIPGTASAFLMAQQEYARLGDKIAARDLVLNDAKEVKHHVNQPRAFFDPTKITSMYAWLHTLATEHPDEIIHAHFFDDQAPIRTSIFEFFSKYPDLMPKNVVLHLFAYDLSLYESGPKKEVHISGTGLIDTQLKQNIKLMMLCGQLSCKEDKSRKEYKMDISKEQMSKMLFGISGGNFVISQDFFDYAIFIKQRAENFTKCLATENAFTYFHLTYAAFLAAYWGCVPEKSTPLLNLDTLRQFTRRLSYYEDEIYKCKPETVFLVSELLACLYAYIIQCRDIVDKPLDDPKKIFNYPTTPENDKKDEPLIKQYTYALLDQMEQYAAKHKDKELENLCKAASASIKHHEYSYIQGFFNLFTSKKPVVEDNLPHNVCSLAKTILQSSSR